MFPSAKSGDPPDKTIKAISITQHCELTIALFILNKSPQSGMQEFWRNIKVGVSKRCCGWCVDYMELLHGGTQYGKNLSIIFRGTHGKQPDGWSLPSTPHIPGLENEMRNLITEKVDKVFKVMAQRHRRSDSAEMPVVSLDQVETTVNYPYLALRPT